MDTTKYRESEMMLERGDGIFLYTDGVTEDTDCNEVLFGEDRLRDFMNAHADRQPREKIDALFEELHTFEKGATQFDDVTMLDFEYRKQ